MNPFDQNVVIWQSTKFTINPMLIFGGKSGYFISHGAGIVWNRFGLYGRPPIFTPPFWQVVFVDAFLPSNKLVLILHIGQTLGLCRLTDTID